MRCSLWIRAGRTRWLIPPSRIATGANSGPLTSTTRATSSTKQRNLGEKDITTSSYATSLQYDEAGHLSNYRLTICAHVTFLDFSRFHKVACLMGFHAGKCKDLSRELSWCNLGQLVMDALSQLDPEPHALLYVFF